ncbi:hypothetical protein Ddc_24184 [Ditylenchus destructor]|nr:hypothetical protein Ddc_24184 [Ditylenchus destructor]
MPLRSHKCFYGSIQNIFSPYIDRNGDSSESGEFPDKVPPNPGVKAHLKIKSKRNLVKILYDEGEGETYAHSPGDDGPDFPLHPTYENSFKVEKRGRINPTYKIEINAGVRRVLLILTGKSKLWFRVHCYACGAWIEVKSNCKESVIKFSGAAGFEESSDNSVPSDASASYHYKSHHSTHKRIHVPLHFESGCTLWKGGNTEQSQHRDREHKDAKNRPKAKLIKSTKTAESSEIMTTTEVALEEPKRKTFIDWILPPGVRRAVKKIPSIKHS